mmetsp:Transcript_63981/g.109823  ORF Transcript_63981/g.109823 Transcript_63981/m.109823 type:complete len:245 (-) Transcript_63981:649-1383(-)
MGLQSSNPDFCTCPFARNKIGYLIPTSPDVKKKAARDFCPVFRPSLLSLSLSLSISVSSSCIAVSCICCVAFGFRTRIGAFFCLPFSSSVAEATGFCSMHFVGGDSARVVHEALAQNELLEVASHRVFECRHFPRQRLFAPRRAHRLLQNGRRGVERLFFRTSQSLAVCVEPERGVAQGQEAVQQVVRHPHVVAVLGEHHLVPRPCAAALGPSPCLAASLLGGGQFVESLVRVREAAGTRRLPT